MAASERFSERYTCTRCGSQATIRWIDQGYRDTILRLDRVEGPAILRRMKSPDFGAGTDCTDVLCARCGSPST